MLTYCMLAPNSWPICSLNAFASSRLINTALSLSQTQSTARQHRADTPRTRTWRPRAASSGSSRRSDWRQSTADNSRLQRFFEEDLFRDDVFLREEDFLRGTLPPARRASERPIAIACFRLVTFLRDRPLFNVPRLRSCIAFSTFCDAFLPYFAIGPPCRGRQCRLKYWTARSWRSAAARDANVPRLRRFPVEGSFLRE